MDLLGHFLRATPGFRGKGRLVNRWVRHPGPPWNRERILPGGAIIHCDLLIPYEAMVWIEAEEETDLQTLRLLLKENQHFVDCGANIGLWTLVAATGVGSGGKSHRSRTEPKNLRQTGSQRDGQWVPLGPTLKGGGR